MKTFACTLLTIALTQAAAAQPAPRVLWTVANPGTAVAMSADGSLVAAENPARVSHALTANSIRSFNTGGSFNQFAFSPSNAFLAGATSTGTFWLMNMSTGVANSLAGVSAGALRKIAFLPDSSVVFRGTSGDRVEGVRTGNLAQFNLYGPTTDPLYAFALAPNGQTLALSSGLSGSGGRCQISFWNVQTGARLPLTITFNTDNPFEVLVYSPDGARIAGAEQQSGAIREFNTGSGALVRTYNSGDLAAVYDLAYDGSGGRLVACGLSDPFSGPFGHIVFYDSNGTRAALLRHFSRIERIAFRADGESFVYVAHNSNGGTKSNHVADHPLLGADPGFAKYTTYGNGCAGSSGATPVLTNFNNELPALGTSFTQRVTGFPVNVLACVLAYGTQEVGLDLAPIGMPGCTGHVLPLFTLVIAQNGGQATHDLPVPTSVFLIGAELRSQAFLPVPGANALGLTASNGARIRVGR